MAKELLARAQVTITSLTETYTVTQSLGGYIFPADSAGTLTCDLKLVDTIHVMQGPTPVREFTIGAISLPAGFEHVSVDNKEKSITFHLAAGARDLPDHGTVDIDVFIAGVKYPLAFVWSKARAGASGADANMLEWVRDWNSGSTQIDASTVITPKLFAGVKHDDGTLTGTALGCYPVRMRTQDGVLTTQSVEGLSTFHAGCRTFLLDKDGSVLLGQGDQHIGYHAPTGKITFGQGVSIQWAGATYIDKEGVFTGTLAATTVRALHLDAGQIVTGKLAAGCIDVQALQAAILTATNIEALTLHIARGTLGGWAVDEDALYSGTKCNNPGAYTSGGGSITLGIAGLRSHMWRLEASGAGALAGGNICWDAQGNVHFTEQVSLQWSAPLDSLTNALGGHDAPKLTHITAQGIYTGHLSAAQITTGTLDANCIAAGSLSAAKLDAASVRSELINADYISGLECSFVRGTLGGWSIGADSISTGRPGVAGATPIQIRTRASGEGFWYDGSYRPYGITMTWCKSANAGHLVLGQVAASGRTVKNDFIGLQMMSWDGHEYFCLAANGQLSGAKEVYNRIAGWAFDHERIWKNNVALGADGAIANGKKWALRNDGSGYVAAGNIAWDAAGRVSFAPAVALQWQQPLEDITSALGGESYPRLTHLDATGIYTGTLTAQQVNALSLDAGAIRTGTLDAERIAAGSLHADKLDARSIRTQIIDTQYIEGLCCTFSRGTIGGWEVTDSTLQAEHITLDSRNRRIAVFGAPQQPGPSVQLHYADQEHYGLEVCDHQGACIARLGSINTIAGWMLDKEAIYTGSVRLGSDGTISNGTHWRLCCDGSGQLAQGSIVWDATGAVRFGQDVSLQWKNDMQELLRHGDIRVRGIGLPTKAREVFINGVCVVEDRTQGLRVLVLEPASLEVISDTLHDTYGQPAVADALAEMLNNLTGECIVVVASYGYVTVEDTLSRALQRLGSPSISYDEPCSYALVGMPELGRNNGLTAYFDDYYTPALLTTRIIDGIPQGVNSNSYERTYIDASGVYTGLVSAAQVRVDSALVVGGRILDGSISVRDATNHITVTLDRTGITAVAGSIGGWNIHKQAIQAAPADGHEVTLTDTGYLHNFNTVSQQDFWALNPDGSAAFGHGTIHFAQDGAGHLAGGNLHWDAAGNLTCRNATLQNIFMTGTTRSPFVAYDGNWYYGDGVNEAEAHDNLTMPGKEGEIGATAFPWDAKQNGRTVSIINHRFRGQLTSGKMSLAAPAGKYFYEDGQLKRKLVLSREYVILKGYGEGTKFYGWIVVHRGDIGTVNRYGSCSKVLYQGWVENGRMLKYKSFDEGMLSCRWSAPGTYEVSFPPGVTIPVEDYAVILCGTCIEATREIHGSLMRKSTTGFTVATLEQSLPRDAAFYFHVISMADWKLGGFL